MTLKGKKWYYVRFDNGKSMNVMGLNKKDILNNTLVRKLGPVTSIKAFNEKNTKSHKERYA